MYGLGELTPEPPLASLMTVVIMGVATAAPYPPPAFYLFLQNFQALQSLNKRWNGQGTISLIQN
ncbi:hypothetical protein [Coxiella-like endosymbiont]|uniref:hypothetical protein n=1 Tax=Coxiella-like endosymbiont TaxID=1592897 RepID=UPI00272BFDCD|nr:hypothetical protein [Coxiella-like endosymbiont]